MSNYILFTCTSEYNSNNKMSKTAKSRFTFSNFLSILTTVITILLLGAFLFTKTAEGNGTLYNYTVQPGDTLWSLSMKYAGNHDPIRWIYETQSLNHLKDSSIQAGYTIKINKYN